MSCATDAERTRGGLLKVPGAVLSLALVFAAPQAVAQSTVDTEDAFVEIHGFVSQGFILTLGNDYLARESTNGSFEFTEVGLNFTKDLTETLSLGAQLFAHELGQRGNYTPSFDWFYLDYRFQDWLGFRAGRLKIPYGLHNENQDVDAARVPVLLPGSVYPTQNRQVLWAHTGGEVYGFARSRPLGAVDYRLFAGTIYVDPETLRQPGSGIEATFDVPYVMGARLLWETPLEGLRLGGSIEAIRIESTAFVPMFGAISVVNRSWLWVASAEYTVSELVLTAEYSQWTTRQRSDAPQLSPSTKGTGERLYGMATYRVTPWLHPGVYYALQFPDMEEREGRENFQHDAALTLRFDINQHWLAKLEGHYMYGTAGLLDPVRVGVFDVSKAEPHWAAFFAKTTAHF